MRIRAIFVDLGGVLIINKAKEVGEKFENQNGLTPEMTKKVFHYIQTSKRTEKEIDIYLKNENINPENWKQFTSEFYASETRNNDLINLLLKISTTGTKIIFTTNNSDVILKGIKKYNIENLADVIVNSSELGIVKPDRAFWETAYRQTQKLIPDIKSEEILVIDDSKTNCLSAKQFGFTVFQYVNSPESLEKIAAYCKKSN